MVPVMDKHKAEATGAVRLFCHAKGVLADGNEKKGGKVARSGGKLVTLKSKYTYYVCACVF